MAHAKTRWVPHPLCGGTVRHWLRLLGRYGGSIQGRGWRRAAEIGLITSCGAPFSAFESLRYRRRIARQPLDPPPVFIIGHWRSGTTHLHDLMLQDPQWGYVSLLQCVIPHIYLTLHGPLTRFLNKRLPQTRPMDNMPTGLNKPMSEDFALVGWSDLTHYLGYFFPQRLEETFRRTVLFEGVTEREKHHWGRTYRWMLQKAALACGGKRLLLKNPPNTGRVAEVLRVFPGAKFIYVYRDPFRVYASTVRLMEKFLTRFALQPWDRREIETAVLRRYRLLIERYDRDRALVPPGHLIEVRHEDVVADPVGTIESIYERLDLPGFDAMRGPLVEHVDSIRDYQTNEYHFDAETIARVREHVGFLLDRWDYPVPAAAPQPQPAEAVH